MNVLRHFSTLAMLAALYLFIPAAHGACTTPDLPYTATPGAVAVSGSLSVGEVIPGSARTHGIKGSCDSSDGGKPITACHLGEGEEVPGMPGVFRTNVDGIGIEMLNSEGVPVRGRLAQCDSRSTPLGYVSSDGSASFNLNVTLRLIKTAATTGHQPLNGRNGIWSLGIYPDEHLGPVSAIRYSGHLALKATTCSVDPTSLTVTLGDFPVTQFTHVGSYSSWKSFNLTALCTDSVVMTARVTSANGATTISDGHDVLNLTPGSDSATGVGVRLLIDGAGVRYDYPIPFGDETIANQSFNLPLQAQYYQISEQVTPGKANTIATIDIEYQ